MQFHPTITAALAEQRQADLRRQAERARLAAATGSHGGRRSTPARRWRLTAQRAAHTQPST